MENQPFRQEYIGEHRFLGNPPSVMADIAGVRTALGDNINTRYFKWLAAEALGHEHWAREHFVRLLQMLSTQGRAETM